MHKIHKNVKTEENFCIRGCSQVSVSPLPPVEVLGSVGVVLVTSASPVSVVWEAAASHPPQPGEGLPFSVTVGRFSPLEISQ